MNIDVRDARMHYKKSTSHQVKKAKALLVDKPYFKPIIFSRP
jgi:hypothetical protein